MGAQLSLADIPITIFELLNELYIAVGAGIWGIFVLVNHGLRNQNYGGTLCLSGLTAACMYYVFNHDELHEANKHKIVVISGCDSGLGYSIALHLHSCGFKVLAGCLDPHSEGARNLETLGVRKFELNVVSIESIHKAVKYVNRILEEDIYNVLWAVVNNAGVMVMAEFEWQTDKLIMDQISVNLIGTMKMTKGFLPLMRQYKSRLVNISSHCALESLPGLAVYGASKAGIKAFTDAIRVELGKYQIKVISFIPGSFPTQSNILAKQMNHVYEMRSAFTKEQEEFYGDYFQRYNSYLSAIANPNPARKLNSPDLYLHLEHALLAKQPKYKYKVEPLRYCIYHALFKISPVCLRDYFVEMFVKMPKYEAKTMSPRIQTLMSMKAFDASSRESLPFPNREPHRRRTSHMSSSRSPSVEVYYANCNKDKDDEDTSGRHAIESLLSFDDLLEDVPDQKLADLDFLLPSGNGRKTIDMSVSSSQGQGFT